MFLLDLIQLLVHSPTPAIHSPDSDRKCLFKFKSTTTAPQKNRRSDIFTTLSVFSLFLRISVMPIYFVPVQYINTLTVSIPATRRHCASVSGGSWFQDLFTHLASHRATIDGNQLSRSEQINRTRMANRNSR